MAASEFSASSWFWLTVLNSVLLSASLGTNEFYHVSGDWRDGGEEVSVVRLYRDRRYVQDAIPRLADDYSNKGPFYHPGVGGKGLSKDDLRGGTRMEMYGNMAMPVPVPAKSGADPSRQEPEKSGRGECDTNQTATGAGGGCEPAKSVNGSSSTGSSSQKGASPPRGTYNTTTSTGGEIVAQVEKVSKKPSEKYPKKTPPEGTAGGESGVVAVTSVNVSLAQDQDTGGGGTGTDEEKAAFDVPDFPRDIDNKVLIKNNITRRAEDNHSYYTSQFIVNESGTNPYWVDMDNEKNVIINEMLSKSHRRAVTVKLSFEFPFYGHYIRNITVATGGFLYAGDYLHTWIAATQYIAPLMANFDTRLSDNSHIKYRDNGTSFTVEWDQVHLQDRKDAGHFTFQTILLKSGDIIFVYKEVPISIEEITDDEHPVKVGVSDAYIIDKSAYFVRRKTIFEYHRVNFKREDITNGTAIYMKALPTCLDYTDCSSCLTHNTSFECKWCGEIGRCSSGFDRKRQDWSSHECEMKAVSESRLCSEDVRVSHMSDLGHGSGPQVAATVVDRSKVRGDEELGHSSMLTGFFIVVICSALSLWVYHAYRNPHTQLGQVLIKYRPSQWSRLRRGEARYTAASIHM